MRIVLLYAPPWKIARNGDPIYPPRRRTSEQCRSCSRGVAMTDYFDLHTLLTSRGCPMQCTFCSSKMMWGKKVRFHSAAYVLNMLETAVNGRGQRILSIKDDSFTADRPRALAICKGIRKRNSTFLCGTDIAKKYVSTISSK